MDGRVCAAGVGGEVDVSGYWQGIAGNYGKICDLFIASGALLEDGGLEFDNEELRVECA